MYFFFAAMMAGSPFAIPERIDPERVSVWTATGGLIDDRPPELAIDPRVFAMGSELDDGSGPPAGAGRDWHDIAAELADFRRETKAPSLMRTNDEGGDQGKERRGLN
jgi:hypothetical protein